MVLKAKANDRRTSSPLPTLNFVGLDLTMSDRWHELNNNNRNITSLFVLQLLLSLVRSNSWDTHLVVPNDLRYARLKKNMGIRQAKEG
ncbi:hypothetical protein TNCV_2155031 [Trichonephila clavipes]|nr:hypothetical protein TNCV_2155031 [Trichonephila clavipes]